MSQALSRNKKYDPPVKGLNTRYSIPTLNDSEASVLTNFQINNSGLLETYPGYTLDGSPFPNGSSNFIRSLFNFKRGTSIDWLLIAAQDTNANSTYKVDIKYTTGDGNYAYITHNIGTAAFTNGNTSVTGTNTQWDTELKAGDKIKLHSDPDSDYTEIASVNSATSITLVGGGYLGTTHSAAAYDARKIWDNSAVPRFTTFNNVAIITNGVDQPQHYDGTSLNNIINTYSGTTLTTSGSTMPKAKYTISHKSRLFFASTTSFPSRLFWTHVNDETTIDALSFEDIFPQDGGSIVSITSFADSVIVLKSNGRIYQVIGNFDDSTAGTVAAIRRLDYSEYIGIIAEQSAVVHNNRLYFMSQNGIYKIERLNLQIDKVSWIVDPEIQNFSFQLGPSASKSFPFDTKTQWDSGTNTGTYAKPDGTLNTFFDDFRITDAYQKFNLCSIAIGSDNVVHVAYVPTSDHTKIKYVRYQPNGITTQAAGSTLVEDTGLSSAALIYSVSISVSNVDNTVGICYSTLGGAAASFRIVERTPDSGATLGVWGASVDIGTGGYDAEGITSISFLYSSGGVPQVAWFASDNSSVALLGYSQRNAGVWFNINIATPAFSLGANIQCSLVLDSSDNPYIGFIVSSSTLYAYKSTNGGATWTQIESHSTSINTQGSPQSYLDHAGNFYTVYTNSSGHIIKRNHTGGSDSTLDSTANSILRGYAHIYQNYQGVAPTAVLVTPIDVDYWLNNHGTAPNQVETYHFEHNGATDNTLTNPTSNVVSKTADIRPSSNPMVNNGQTIANINFGTNANEVIVRRITFYGRWTSPQNTDSGLTAWGNYVVSGSTPNGGTLSYQLALASGGTANSFVNVTPPVLVSSNAALNIAAARVFWTIGSWAGASIDSIILNYTGSGVSATAIVATDFFNELYFAGTQTGQSSNNIVIESDIAGSFLEVGYPVSAFANYKTSLYGGSSLKGDLYKLKQGYMFNGSTYSCDCQFKEDFLGNPIQEKDFYKVYVIFEVQSAGTFSFSYRTDAFAGSSTWTSTTIDQTSLGYAEIPINDFHKRSIQFRAQSTANGFATKIIGFILVFGLNNLR